MPRASIHLAFACSGAAALIYEVAWTRLLTLSMGHTVAAASTVLAAFMGGLALGAALAGRAAPRLERAAALRAYAGLELLIAVAAIALPYGIAALEPLLAAAYRDGDGGATFGLVRLLSSLLAVTLPAVAMGATLPLVVRWAVADARGAGGDTGLLYAANTAGAAAGAVLSGFALLPALGLRGATLVGVGLNLASAAMAWRLASKPVPRAAPTAARAIAARRPRHAVAIAPAATVMPTGHVVVPAMALAVSGCVSLMLQVAWTRILALVVGPTTFAFSAVVATFIAGIALGSLCGGWIARRTPAIWPLAASLLAAAVASSAASAYAPHVPLFLAGVVTAPDASFATVVRLQSFVIAALMMPMAVAFGAAFPLAVGLAARTDAAVSRDVSTVYVANTAGAIAGALLAGFWLVPRFGLENTARLAAVLAAAGGAVVAAGTRRGRGRAAAAAGAAAVAVFLALALMPRWDRKLLSSGAYKYAPYLTVGNTEALLRAGSLLYYREGAAATVSVRELTGSRSLAIDGKVDASNAGDMLTQKLLAHVPLLMHPAPRRVAVIGLGSGVTAGAALRHPVDVVDVLEISPEVVEASGFFERENHGALRDPRLRLILGDGRSHMLLGRSSYDVIISEPSNPWMAGVAQLFTREFFEAARRRLTPGGILCQWAHTYDIGDADLRSIVRTFAAVFPHAALWLVGDGDLLLTGSDLPFDDRLERMRAVWNRRGIADDLREVGATHPESILALYTAGGGDLRAYAGAGDVQTDDRLALEFSAPRSIYGRSSTSHADVLRSLVEDDALPGPVRRARSAAHLLVNRARMQARAGGHRAAIADFARALEHDPLNQQAIEGLLESAAAAGRMLEAERLVRGLLAADPQNTAAAIGLSRLLAARGDFEAALEALRPLFASPSADLRAVEQLASVLADAGDAQRLAAVVADLQRIAPEAEPTMYYAAAQLFMTGRHDEAIAVAERLCAKNPRHASGHNLLGAAYGAQGQRDRARRSFEAAILANPRDVTAYTNLGTFELQAGNAAAAAERFAEALTLDPASAAARDGLAQADAPRR